MLFDTYQVLTQLSAHVCIFFLISGSVQTEIIFHPHSQGGVLKTFGACVVGTSLSPSRNLLLTGLHLQQGRQSWGSLLPNRGAGRLKGVCGNGPGHL